MAELISISPLQRVNPDHVVSLTANISVDRLRLWVHLSTLGGDDFRWEFKLDKDEDRWTEDTAKEKIEDTFAELLRVMEHRELVR